MNKLTKITLLALLLLLALPMRQFAQTPYRQYSDDGILLDFFQINDFYFRIYLLYNLNQNDQFILTQNEEWGQFSVNSNDESGITNFYDAFEAFYNNTYTDFGFLSKTDLDNRMPIWKNCIPDTQFLSITMDIAMRSNTPTNNHCVDSDPFCTSDVITFDAATSSQTADELEGTTLQDGCIGSSYNPSWFHMRIQTGGQFIIHAEGHDPNNGTNRDIDFCIWGPYTNPTSPCVSQLTTDKIIDCCFSASYSEDIYLGYQPGNHTHNSSHGTVYYHLPETGEYYILMITNYSRQPCTISFTKTANSGPGETDCGILPGVASNDGPYCVGETIHLSVNAQDGATYSWTGPGGFSSNQQNPTRVNCTMAMAGIYTCVTTVGNQTTSATTEVIIYPMPTANFDFTSVCVGNTTTFTNTSTTNPSGQQINSYNWNFGDGQTGIGANVTHTYQNAGSYPVTLTVSTGGHCTDHRTQTVPVYAAPIASATATPSTVIYGGTATLTASAGAQGTFNFHWEPANMVTNPDAQTTQTVPLQATQTYTVTVTNTQGGCSSTSQVTVSMEGSNMTAMASADQTELCEGASTTLHAQPSGGTGNYTYTWSPANSLNNANIQNPIATPPVGTTTYTCNVSDGITAQNVSVSITVHPNEVEDVEETICENDTYNFYGEIIQTPGIYEYHTQTEFGCDKLIRMHLSNWDIYETPITRHFCQGDSYDFFGTTLTSSGTYYHTLESIHGCDSVIRLHLIQDLIYETELWESTCEGGQGYYYQGDYLQPSAYPYTYHYETVAGCDSVVMLHIAESEYNSKTYNVSLCATEFTWGSNGRTYYETGTYYDTLSFPNACDSTIVLNLELRPSFDTQVTRTSCDNYHWKDDEYNVDLTFDQSTVYTHHYTNIYGCPSEVTLFLTINDHDVYDQPQDNAEIEYTGVTGCDSALWSPRGHAYLTNDTYDPENHWYTRSSLAGHPYQRTYKNLADCDSIVSFPLTLQYTPQPSAIYPVDANNTAPHWVVSATEFQINSYEFSLWEKGHPSTCQWESINWAFEDPNVLWLLEPDSTTTPIGKNCKMYVLNYIEDTIWLTATIYNRCAPQGVSQRYWFVCSFYGVEEQQESIVDFSVVPNPNNGTMTLNFEKLTGKIDLKVYDMKGNLIDQLNTYSIGGPETMQYDMRHRSKGIYFFVATGKEGTVAKKVVISR